jgi:hypothetical protein
MRVSDLSLLAMISQHVFEEMKPCRILEVGSIQGRTPIAFILCDQVKMVSQAVAFVVFLAGRDARE